MRKQRVVVVALVILVCGLAGGYLLLSANVLGQPPEESAQETPPDDSPLSSHRKPHPELPPGVFVPETPPGGKPIPWHRLPPPPVPPDLVPLTPEEKIGKFMIFDTFLSDPPGYACTTCHILDAGNTGPSSRVNEFAGTMPGVRPNRWSNRKPQTYGYAAFSPYGPYFDNNLGVWIGGNFWDGRVVDLVGQAQQPPINPVEMANTPTNGIYPPPFGGYSALLAEKLQHRPYTHMLKKVWGPKVFEQESAQQIYIRFAQGVSAVQGSGEVCQFSSKWDASTYGTPPKQLYTLSASEERGRILYGSGPNPSNDPKFGSAQCFACHDSTGLANGTRPASDVPTLTQGKNTFTMFCYANIGVPKNVNNHYYLETDCQSNPHGCNPLGFGYIDYGLGANPNRSPTETPSGVPLNGGGTRFFNTTEGDILQYRGLFKAPTTRNVDRRPHPKFVKAYMHNGVFTSLKDVVHFYNKRNIAVNANGQEVAFDLRDGPPAGYTRLFPPPEVIDNVQNVAGRTPADAGADVATNGQVGNLQLTPQQEADVVNFLKILSDGYTKPNPVPNPFGNP